jgi:hypothetical protein
MNTVTFTDKEFEVFRKFQNKINGVFGETAYVGSDYATVILEYSPTLKALLRPSDPKNPVEKKYGFEVKLLSCKDCKKTSLFMCLPEEENYVCDECIGRRKKKG